jgi:hypothetical protein
MTARPGSIWSPPAVELTTTEEQLDQLVSRLDASVTAILEDWTHRTRSEILEPYRAVLERTEAAHSNLAATLEQRIEDLDLAEAGHPRRYWQAVCTYMEDVQDDCVKPVLAYLGESNPLESLDGICESAQAGLRDSVAGLPERATLPRSPDLYMGRPGQSLLDGVPRIIPRVRDSWRAASRRAANVIRNLWGGTARPLLHPSRAFSPRSIAAARILSEVSGSLDAAERELRDCLERELKTMERGVWTWCTSGLRHLADIDAPSFHTPAGLRLQWRGEAPPLDREPVDEASPGLTFSKNLSFLFGDSAILNHPSCGTTVENLRADLEVAGTVLYRGSGADIQSRSRSPSPNFAHDRILLADSLLSVGRAVRDLEGQLLEEIGREAFGPLEQTCDAVRDRLSEIEEEALRLVEGRSQKRLPKQLEELLAQCASLEDLYSDLPGLSAADRVLTHPGISGWQALLYKLDQLPRSLDLRSMVGESPRVYRADLHRIARNAFERPLSPRIEPAADPLRRAVAHVWSDTEHVMDVVRTTFLTAIQQLESPQDQGTGAPDRSDLIELIQTGLRRAGASLEERYLSVDDEWAALVTRVQEVLAEDWNRVFRSVQSEDFLAKQLMGIQTMLSRQADRTWKRLEAVWESTSTFGRTAGRLIRLRARDLIRIGRTAVGASGASVAERHQALDTVASARSLYGGLPLVYRRLFSVEPVTDAGLAQNRDEDLRSILTLIHRWRRGVGAGALVVHGPLGSGRTTFLKLLESRLKGDIETAWLSLEGRPESENDLADVLAKALYPDLAFEGGLDELDGLIHAREESKSRLVLIDNLELLLFQAAGGTRLLHQLLLFCIRTDDRLAWCGAVGSLAWQFAQRAAPAAARLAVPLELRAWDDSALRDMILARHRRSGIPLEFSIPKDPTPLVGQRLRRARTPEAAQRILAGEFFDSLFRAAGQNPTRALFEWIRAGQFAENLDNLSISPLKQLSFTYLQRFEDDIAFTLRSLLVHNTLTVEEHGRLFRGGLDGAIMAFETLQSEGLIEALDDTEGEAIVPACRYRLRRLVLEPVHRSLRERHFVY